MCDLRQSGAHLSFRFARLQRLREQIQSWYITDIERTTIRWYNISWNWPFRTKDTSGVWEVRSKKFGWNVILIIAIRKIVNSREWHFGFYVCRILAFRDFITSRASRFRHLGGLTSSPLPHTRRANGFRDRGHVVQSFLVWRQGETPLIFPFPVWQHSTRRRSRLIIRGRVTFTFIYNIVNLANLHIRQRSCSKNYQSQYEFLQLL